MTNPRGPATGYTRVFRSGFRGNYARSCRSANRDNFIRQGDSDPGLGFRPVLAPTSNP